MIANLLNFVDMNIREIKTKEQFDEAVEKVTKFSEAIRLKCYDCSAMQMNEVRLCTVTTCPLYKFRFGRKPKEK